VRLVILSSAAPGSQASAHLESLRALARELRVADDFEILDFTANPFAYMARAGVFASSSTSEGFGNVVAEALACGCPVVSTRTDGPIEVLENGRYGRLVPVGDVGAMAAALSATLRAPRDSAEFVLRAAAFGEDRAARAYELLCREVGATAQAVQV
jgi:glycosyltransferase involved in cell wall biosynthesis